MKHFIAITENSVWLVTKSESGSLYVEDRATFGSPYIEDGRRFEGEVTFGSLKTGSRLTFVNIHPDGLDRTFQSVSTGAINRVVAFEDAPHVGAPEGFIDITPSWEAIAPVNETTARQAGKQADRLVSLHDLGRINDDDIRAADARTSERMS